MTAAAAAAEINPRFVVVADLLICPAWDRFRHSASQMDAQKEIARIDDDDTWAAVAMRPTIHGSKRLFTQMDTQNVTSIEIGRTDGRASPPSFQWARKPISFPSF